MAALMDAPQERQTGFSRDQSLLIALLAFTQFTIILDFIIMSPLGAILMPSLNITTGQFGVAVSAYAFSAGLSGILAAGFADRFDRKHLLLFFYVGFTLGTLLCAVAQNYHVLLFGRIVTGLFGGVIGSVVLAIITDLFPLHLRGRVMGFVQTAFAASQVLGIPAGLFLANHWNWHVCFAAIVGLSTAAIIVIAFAMQPVDAHLRLQQDGNPFRHLIATVGQPRYTLAFAVTTLLGDRRLRADAVQQRLYRAQSWHRHRAPSDNLSRLRSVYHCHGAPGRPGERRVRQVSDLCLWQRGVRHYGADLHPSRSGRVDHGDRRQRADVSRHLLSDDPVAGVDVGNPRAKSARIVQRGQRVAAAALRRARFSAGGCDHCARAGWFADPLRSAGIHRRHDVNRVDDRDVLCGEVGGEADG
jgi:hypothetical protein